MTAATTLHTGMREGNDGTLTAARAEGGLAGAIFRGREDGLCVGGGEEAVERGMRAVHVLADDAEANPRAESAGQFVGEEV